MSEAGGTLFLDALHRRVDDTLDACTRCGKCVEACPMVEPAGLDPGNAVEIVTGVLDLIAGGEGTPDAERWAQVCTNSGRCIPACDYGVNPRLMVNMARIASKAKAGDDAVRRAGHNYFTTMGRSTRVISRLQLPPEVIARINPPLRPAGEYPVTPPDIVFYTGCNIIKTPHIALLVLDVLDALGVSYEVMGGTSSCCGIQQFKQGDAKTAGRIGYNTIERLARPGASRVISWCPSCQIQIGEVALPAYQESYGAMPFDLNPIAEFFAERLDDLRPLFVHPVPKRVALQERAALPGVVAAVKTVLRAIPELEVVELDVPVVSTQANHLSVLPKFKAELRQREFAAAAEAGVTTFASIFHGCHRELVKFQPQVSFELLNFMELIGEAMGIHIPDLYKRLSMLGDVDAIITDSADLIATHRLDLDTVRDVLADDIYGGGASVANRSARPGLMSGALLLDQRRSSIALRCAAALLFSIAFLWPAIGVATLVNLFAAYAFTDGILTVSTGGWSRAERATWPLLIGGCIDIAAAASAFFWPEMAVSELAGLVVVWAMVLGLSFAIASLTLRDADGDHLLLLSGVAGVLFGRVLLSHLGAELIVIATWMGLYALTSGILLFKLSIQLYRPIAIDVSAQ